MDAVSLLQAGSAFLLNVGFTWLVGSWCARYWMRYSGVHHGDFEPQLRLLDLVAAGLGALASVAALLAATAVMGGVGLREACPMFWMMLTSTRYGNAGAVTIVAMLVLSLIRWTGVNNRAGEVGTALALMLFAVTRASMGHAGEAGLLSAPMAAEAVHYAAIGLWTGAVLTSAWFALNDGRIGSGNLGVTDRYLDLMSRTAMAAVAAIVATGVYNGWLRVGAAEHLFHTFYGRILLVKVALVLVAIALGGYNKYFGLPAASRSTAGVRTARTVLRIESGVLLATLLAAAILTAQQPPAAM